MMRVQLHKFIDLAPSKAAKPGSQEHSQQKTIDRRSFLSVATALAGLTGMASTAFARNFGVDAEPQRYPDPDIVVLDKRFKYKLGNSSIQRMYRGRLWAEGPAWSTVGRIYCGAAFPITSSCAGWKKTDIHRFVSRPATVTGCFDHQAGMTLLANTSRIAWCATSTMGVTVLAENAGGKPLNAQRYCRASDDGSIWNRSGYGTLLNYEGHRENSSSSSAVLKGRSHRCSIGSGGESGRGSVQTQRHLLFCRLQETLCRRHGQLSLPGSEKYHLGL